MVTERGRGRPFEDPINVPGGEVATLLEAGRYIAGLPKAIHNRPEWLAAAEVLMLVVERSRPTMTARIGDDAGAKRGQSPAGAGASSKAPRLIG